MDKVRLGMIGCGFGARDLYAPFFRYLNNGEVVAVMDVDEARARKVQALSGCRRFYMSLTALLADDEIDAVMVLTPTHLHADQVVQAAEAGKHVYCEKPMARTVEEADCMIAACARCGVKFQVAFMKRFNRSLVLAKQVIDEGQLGDIFEMRAVWDNARAATSAQANYRHRVQSGGGFLQEDGSHPLDVCRWWMGDVDEVSAHVMVVAANRFENDDVGMVAMKHKSGALSSLHITMLTHRTGMESYEVFGTRATLLVRFLYHSTHSIEPAIVELHQGAKRVTDLTLGTSWNVHEEMTANWQYLNELRHFCDCILHDKQPRVTGVDGRAVVEIINAAYLSSQEGRNVKLPLAASPDFESLFGAMRQSSRWSVSDEDAWWSRY